MISYKKAKLKDKPMLIKYKLLTILPFIKDDAQKLQVIAYVNNFVAHNYLHFKIIHQNFKKIGIYCLLDNELDTLYIKDKYQKKGYGTKILNNIKININTIKINPNNSQALKFYQKNGFTKVEVDKNYIILRKE